MPLLLAHPLTEDAGLGLPPLALAAVATVIVAAVLTLSKRWSATGEPDEAGLADIAVALGRARCVTRALAVAVLVLGIYAARRGSPDGLANLAPALVVGVAWPLLVLGSVALPRLWRWVDPWDAVARAIEPLAGSAPADGPVPADATTGDPSAGYSSGDASIADASSAAALEAVQPAGSVWPGVVAAAAVMYFLIALPTSTQPRSVGAALAAYTIVMVAIGVALGRYALARTEVFGLTARWAGHLRSGFAARWLVPEGAEAVLGVLAGGLLFDLARRAPGYDEALTTGRLSWASTGDADRDVLLGLAICALVGAVTLHLFGRWAARRGAAGSVAAAALPVVLALVVVVKLRRFLVSLQLVRILVSDPLGRGVDLFGTAGGSLDANPFGTTAQRVTAIVVVTLAGVAGAIAVRRRTRTGRQREPAGYAVYLLVALGTMGLAVAA
ncbi:MAG TPA: hypothetical protein VNB94_08515 [Mycobacteriales bacterium]|nr:hypothetical protein [Mycobacteriales bacterium]